MLPTNISAFWAELVVVVVLGVTVLFYVIPAYRRSRRAAFLWLAFGFIVVICNSVADHTVGLLHMTHGHHLVYSIARRLTRLPGFAFVAYGVISLTRLYLATPYRRENSTSDA